MKMTEKEMLQRILHDIMVLKKLFQDSISTDKTIDIGKDILNTEECAELTGLKKSTLYRLTHERKIPFFKPNGNRVFFKRTDIIDWLQSNRVPSATEIDREAANHLVRHHRRAP